MFVDHEPSRRAQASTLGSTSPGSLPNVFECLVFFMFYSKRGAALIIVLMVLISRVFRHMLTLFFRLPIPARVRRQLRSGRKLTRTPRFSRYCSKGVPARRGSRVWGLEVLPNPGVRRPAKRETTPPRCLSAHYLLSLFALAPWILLQQPHWNTWYFPSTASPRSYQHQPPSASHWRSNTYAV